MPRRIRLERAHDWSHVRSFVFVDPNDVLAVVECGSYRSVLIAGGTVHHCRDTFKSLARRLGPSFTPPVHKIR